MKTTEPCEQETIESLLVGIIQGCVIITDKQGYIGKLLERHAASAEMFPSMKKDKEQVERFGGYDYADAVAVEHRSACLPRLNEVLPL